MEYKPFAYLLASMCLFCISIKSFASNPVKPAPSMQATNLMQKSKTFLFEENKGQLMDENRKAITNIKYYGHSGGVYLYCKPGMLSFVFTNVEKKVDEKISEATGTLSPAGVGREWKNPKEAPQPSKICTSRTDLVLLCSNPNAQIIASDQQEYYENFYTTGDADHGITNVHTCKIVTYKSIYSNIDMILQAKEQGMEYSFIVHPGGKVSDIQLQWNGTEGSEALANGGFKFSNSLGTIEESSPKSFAEGKVVRSSFVKNGFSRGFKVGRYDEGKDLVIDPSLTWATYYGENIYGGFGVSTDASGNVYIIGTTTSSNGIAASSGAYQAFYGGGAEDAFLAKFSSSGSLSWATYYGGSGSDQATGVSTDASGNVFITGQTTSKSGIATKGAYQTSFAGTGVYTDDDAFLAKFNSSGSLSWSTYYGGSGYNGANSVSTDASGNVYITGETESSSGIATSGAYQTIFNAIGHAAFLAKFSSSGSLSWATYFVGSSEGENGSGVSTDASGNVYIIGNTESNSGITTSGAYQTSFAGSYDAFLAKFSSSGSLAWATYFGENGEIDGNAISTDGLGNVYITGETESTSGVATLGAYQTSNGGTNAFLAKFSSSGSLSWATYYGGTGGVNGGDMANGVATDVSGNVYITGYTYSISGIATSGAYQTSLAGGNSYADAFLAKFSSSGSLSWATYYGGSGEDRGYGISTDASGNVYITGYTESSNGIATVGAYQTTYKDSEDIFLAKFNGSSSGISPKMNTDLYSITIYPNPFSDKTLINFTLPGASHVKISMMDMKGNVLYVPADKMFSPGSNEVEINATEIVLTPGTYFVNIEINNQFTTRKIIEVR